MIALKPGGANGLALIVATLALIVSATAQPDGDQFRIGRVVIDRRLVFEVSSTGGPQVISAAANRIHFLTRERIIANELLFREGERYDHNLVEETERNLRKMNIIGEVTIRRDTVDDHTVDLTVHTRDRWSLELGGAFKQEGGIQTYRLTLQDYNFLGNAQRVKLSLNRRTDRIDPDGLELLFYERRLFGSRWEGRLQYRQAEELTLHSIALRRQYSTEAATWAAGAHADRRDGLYYHYSQGARDSTFHLSQSNMDAWLSASLGEERKLRAGAAVVGTRTASSDLPLGPADNYSLLIFSLSPRRREYYKARFLDNFGRVEDVPKGYLVNFMAGKNFYHGAANTADYYLRGDLICAHYLKHKYYLGLRSTLSTFLLGGESKELISDWDLRYFHKWSEKHTFAARVKYVHGQNWSEFRQMILGGANGLRGFPAYEFDGRRLFLLNVEDRIFTPWQLWIFRFGGVVFADFGGVWGEEERFSPEWLHPSFGIGLRIENVVQQGSGILRIDFAFQPDKRGLAEISVTTNQLFSAFTAIRFIPPNIVR